MATNNGTALRLDEVDAYYGDSHVLAKVSFSAGAGRLLGLLGRNGAGKTTCMATIMGLLRPRRGAIRLYGEPVEGLAPDAIARKGICLVPQGRRMFRSLTVRENLMVAAQSRKGAAGSGWSIDRVFQIFPRLRERHAQLAGSLSGGEQQMLAIGRALMTNPKLLILDEATEGLAPLIRQEIWNCLSMLKASGQSILVIDKNVEHLTRICDRHYIIERGRTVWSGTSVQLMAEPDLQHRYLGI